MADAREREERKARMQMLERENASLRAQLQTMTIENTKLRNENADVFAIPDYFVYMSRAFATLEGIGLSADPQVAATAAPSADVHGCACG